MVYWFALALLCLGGCAQPQAETSASPFIERMEQERAKLESLPADADLKTRFASVYVLDQQPRMRMGDIMQSDLSPDEKSKALGEVRAFMYEQDPLNLQVVLDHLPPEGWYLRSRYGDEVATTAFLVVQHSNLETWQRFVPVLEPLVAAGEISGPSYALMYDRLALAEGKPQRYGSQVTCQNGQWVVLELEAPETVDERRREMGFPDTHAEYLGGFASMPCQ
ncbi:DUF6624 domain-containing protein [uncultured Brevundimonas sp.]|uniref:DUF6624 domain-containing protein n=1 Tax=uncultured Brevundimonas sp. TaxID=213418 RepID=UPI002631722F|nr:DUF6624 domain-containing protein [uncultured Brevundimonas sp.]